MPPKWELWEGLDGGLEEPISSMEPVNVKGKKKGTGVFTYSRVNTWVKVKICWKHFAKSEGRLYKYFSNESQILNIINCTLVELLSKCNLITIIKSNFWQQMCSVQIHVKVCVKINAYIAYIVLYICTVACYIVCNMRSFSDFRFQENKNLKYKIKKLKSERKSLCPFMLPK